MLFFVSNEGVKGDDESLSPHYMPLDEETFESLAAREYAVSSEIAAEQAFLAGVPIQSRTLP